MPFSRLVVSANSIENFRVDTKRKKKIRSPNKKNGKSFFLVLFEIKVSDRHKSQSSILFPFSPTEHGQKRIWETIFETHTQKWKVEKMHSNKMQFEKLFST